MDAEVAQRVLWGIKVRWSQKTSHDGGRKAAENRKDAMQERRVTCTHVNTLMHTRGWGGGVPVEKTAGAAAFVGHPCEF